MKAMSGPGRPGRPSVIARFGPLAGICVTLIAVVGVLVATTPGDTIEAASQGGSQGTPTTADEQELPNGVLPWSVAEARGETGDIDWGERCDTTKGVLALPVSPAQGCFAPFDGPNGGATSAGVTEDAIKVVVYLAQDNDPVLSFIYSQIGNTDTSDDVFATYQGYSKLLGTYDETYGREIELIRYDATGAATDAVSATADAETIARDIRPFVVIGGPVLTDAFADTLAANQVMCISCTPGQTIEWYQERGPYVWDVQKNVSQSAILAAEYVGKRLANGDAEFGGAEVADMPRKFGLIYLSSSASSEAVRADLERTLDEDYGVQFADVASFASPVGIAAEAREVLARMKSEGITTILYSGDPLAPQTLTRTATEQDYYPEWVITGSALVDTTIFSRTYDQAQWAHAFGPSNLFARVSPSVSGSVYLYNWFFGEEPPARTTAALILPTLQFLYSVLQGVGTDVSPEMFQAVIFGADIVDNTVLSPQISWGERGIWPGVDYAGVDDQTEVWWDAEAVGEDETGRVAAGMWAYVDGGARYLPGEWPDTTPAAFDPEGAVTLYTDLPDGITLPNYEPLPPA